MKRTLKCKPGYNREGHPLTVTCDKNGTWTRTTATCKKDRPQMDYRILAIVVGSLVAITIPILVAVKIYLSSRKKIYRFIRRR
ncbi:hypothetical protein AVEN_169151-1 [Araneus ventricosus]|uniref:Sushi domain-containing protein n=2 Tax=Araneus ventricosus TaxID=182803 RepID=A0A4Y2SP73_ARAVE|nr:hypothetical protein AVEN_169151-1 [Araneus ventricosus]